MTFRKVETSEMFVYDHKAALAKMDGYLNSRSLDTDEAESLGYFMVGKSQSLGLSVQLHLPGQHNQKEHTPGHGPVAAQPGAQGWLDKHPDGGVSTGKAAAPTSSNAIGEKFWNHGIEDWQRANILEMNSPPTGATGSPDVIKFMKSEGHSEESIAEMKRLYVKWGGDGAVQQEARDSIIHHLEHNTDVGKAIRAKSEIETTAVHKWQAAAPERAAREAKQLESDMKDRGETADDIKHAIDMSNSRILQAGEYPIYRKGDVGQHDIQSWTVNKKGAVMGGGSAGIGWDHSAKMKDMEAQGWSILGGPLWSMGVSGEGEVTMIRTSLLHKASQRHLPGKHNQKEHTPGHGPVAVQPGAQEWLDKHPNGGVSAGSGQIAKQPERMPEHIKTSAEAQAYMNQRYPNISTGGWESVPDAIAVKTLRQLDVHLNAYPELAEKSIRNISAVPFLEGRGHEYAHALLPKRWADGSVARGYIEFNTNWYGSHKKDGGAKLEKQLAQNVKTKWLAAGTPESIATHEFGHVLQGYLEAHGHMRFPGDEAVSTVSGFGEIAASTHLFVNSKENLAQAGKISKCAKTNEKEAWAESFSAIHHVPESKWSPYTKKHAELLGYVGDGVGKSVAARPKYTDELPKEKTQALRELATRLGI